MGSYYVIIYIYNKGICYDYVIIYMILSILYMESALGIASRFRERHGEQT